MSKVIVKRFNPYSVFKSIIMAISVPYVVAFGLMIIFLIIIAASFDNISSLKSYLTMVLPMIILPLIYGIAFMIFALSYNWLAPKFGGLEIEIEDKNHSDVNY